VAGSATSGAATPAGSARPASTTARPGTGSPGAATTGTAGAGNTALTQTYSDTTGGFKFQYPTGWTATRLANSQSNIVEIDGPDNISFYVDIYDQAGTPDDEMQETITGRQQSTQIVFTPNPVMDATVAGEQGKMLTYSFKRSQGSTISSDGVLWIVNHNGHEYDFEAVAVGKHRPEIDAIVQSIVFL
jgi:hypothetical protein